MTRQADQTHIFYFVWSNHSVAYFNEGIVKTFCVHAQVQLEVDVKFVQDTLMGDDLTEIRVKFVKNLKTLYQLVKIEFIYVSTNVSHLAAWLIAMYALILSIFNIL